MMTEERHGTRLSALSAIVDPRLKVIAVQIRAHHQGLRGNRRLRCAAFAKRREQVAEVVSDGPDAGYVGYVDKRDAARE